MHKIDIAQLEFIHPIMRELLADIEKRFGPQIITSLYRIDDTGVHGTLPLRGVDLRARKHSFGGEVVKWVNKYWEYDHERKKYKVAKDHGEDSNYHIHLQVHPNTKQRG